MEKIFVDSNVFLRFLMKDDPVQSGKAKTLFKRAENKKIGLITGPPVLFEIAWTLKSFYKVDRDTILKYLASIIAADFIEMTDKNLAAEAVTAASSSGEDFAEAYICVSAKKLGAKGVATFNRKHFDRLDCTVIEPQ